jgi:hypothetical protein
MVGMVHTPILLDRQLIVILENDDCALVTIGAAVVGRTENSHDWRERLGATPLVHLVTIDLDLMSSHHREQVVLFKELFHGREPKFEGTLPLTIMFEINFESFGVFNWVRPE